MNLRVLGCHGGELPKHRTTCFLVDGKLCVDGGAITSVLSLEEILQIEDIIRTHRHFNHMKDVPMMTDVLVGRRQKPVVVHGPAETMEAMDKDVFNNRVWPDFRVIPSADNPVIAFEQMPIRQTVTCQGYRIRAIPVHHPVYSVGYIFESKSGAVAFSGDTGPTDELWRAIVSGHLTPRTVLSELEKLDRRGARIYLYHLKPSVIDEVKKEIAALRRDYLQICELDDVYTF